jgi:ribosomal protein S18 acetylase RimI-like enzyme
MDKARVTSSGADSSSHALTVRLATGYDLKKIYEHHQRHFAESGVDGDVVFAPSLTATDKTLDEFADQKFEAFEKTSKQVGWERMWIVTDEEAVYGMLRLLHSPRMESALHRALLQMGIERKCRASGFGSKLMQAAIGWARAEGLEWITLFVFEHNEPAKALYRKFGFSVVGTTRDLFRLRGLKIDDTEMVLHLPPAPAAQS